MSYFPVFGDIIEARIVTVPLAAPPQIGENVVHFIPQPGSIINTGASLAEFLVFVTTTWGNLYKQWLSVVDTFRGVSAQRVFPKPTTPMEFNIGASGVGVVAGSHAPTQVSGLIKTFTAKAGRPFRGRLYIPWIATSNVTLSGDISNTGIADLTAIGNSIFALQLVVGATGTTTFQPVIWHKKGYGKPVPIGVNTTDPITSSAASILLATQRKRGNYGRPNPAPPF
jgi:hypothetical protein